MSSEDNISMSCRDKGRSFKRNKKALSSVDSCSKATSLLLGRPFLKDGLVSVSKPISFCLLRYSTASCSSSSEQTTRISPLKCIGGKSLILSLSTGSKIHMTKRLFFD